MQIGEIGFRGGTHGAFVVSVVGSDVIIETWRAPVIAGFVASIVGIGLAILGAGLRFSYRRARANPLRTVDPGLRPALYVVAGLVALSGALAIIGGATLIVHDEEGRGGVVAGLLLLGASARLMWSPSEGPRPRGASTRWGDH